uniref:NADH-ubiquinone oxidoreductase chain 4 n=1 Tax=Caryopemon giganteus TaxID=2758555 RepID=A0A7D6ZRX8_9CUCU|nr:NADH dehydrogenase subunit 4 [Caryopemon giganteus]QLX47630.1 NADH dehydrogenase subunit 4 [Caryopemon giganteus]
MMAFFCGILFLIPLTFLINFWMLVLILLSFSFMFSVSFSFDYSYSMLTYLFGLDLIGYVMVLLTFWLCSLMMIASVKIHWEKDYSDLFNLMLMCLLLVLLMVFSSLNLFIFYLFFEVSLIPTLILIIGWGYQPERLEAGIYLLFYTLIVSLPMMISIFYCYGVLSTMIFNLMDLQLSNFLIYLCMNMVFFVKIPMFFVHLWLPKAHVEAPVAGSMILAGIMLKLGGYGLMRLMKLFMILGLKINLIFISISLLGGFLISMICMRQSDMKSLIAYSSVAHMGLVLSGILTMNIWGFWGSLVMMLAHGLCSSGLFCLTNIIYERTQSRSIYLNKGLMNIIPSISLWWFLFCSSNMAAPPSLNLLGEVILITSLITFSWLTMWFLSLISFFSAAYSLFLFSYTQHGSYNSGIYSLTQVNLREYLLLVMHWLPLNLLVLMSENFTLCI